MADPVPSDVWAIQEDALLIDIAAMRGDLTAFADDPLASLFAAFTTDVDDCLELLVMDDLFTPDRAVHAVSDRGRRPGARFLVAAGTAVALMATSGVAAAVSGDPLLPLRQAVKVVAGSADDADQSNSSLPDQAAAQADLATSLTDVNRAIANGDLAVAQQLLDAARGNPQLLAALPPGLAQHLDAVQDKIDRGTDPAAGGGSRSPGPNQSTKENAAKNQSAKDNAAKNQSGKEHPVRNQSDKGQRQPSRTKDPGSGTVDQSAVPGKAGKETGSAKGRPAKKDPSAANSAERNPPLDGRSSGGFG